MRDVVTGFYLKVLRGLIEAGKISTSDSILVVCGGPLDEEVLAKAGLKNATITNLDLPDDRRQDAENLTYASGSFDIAIVHAGLHHCHSPHRGLLEMYRVARKLVIAFEARDSLLMRVAVRLGFTMDYEVNSVDANGNGGVANTGVPNFIYRWTEREVLKTISSYHPAAIHDVDFYYDLRLPIQRFERANNRLAKTILTALEPASFLFLKIFPKQGNEFAFVIHKSQRLHQWMAR